MFNSMQKLKQASPKARRPNTILSTNRKGANTNKKTATDMNTLLRYMEANGMKNEKIESFPASELDHLLSKFFLNARKKNGEDYEPATVSSFQRSIQRHSGEKKYPLEILKDEFEKSRSVQAARCKSLVRGVGRGGARDPPFL